MSRRAVVLLVCCALFACREDAPPPAAAKTPPPARIAATPDNDSDNSLNLMYGAAVVSRTGELHLENSAVHTIDGFAETIWTSAPGVPEETLVYSMLAPTRLQRVGISTNTGNDAVDSVAFAASMDGETWTELGTLKTTRTDERQFLDVKPTVAHYLRVRTVDPARRYYVRLRGVHAIGEEVAAPKTPSFSGCWMINGERAHLEQHGARITGVIESDPPAYIDGGTDNRAGMIMWMRGLTWGYAVITRSPDGEHLSGLSFYEEVDKNIGEGWFGERCNAGRGLSSRASSEGPGRAGRQARASSPTHPGPSLDARDDKPRPTLFLARAKRYSLYGLVFDANDRLVDEVSTPALDALASLITSTSQPMRIVARELRYTPEQNRQHAAARLQAIRTALEQRGVNLARIAFVNAGNDTGGIVLRSSLQRALLSRVDLVSGT